MTKYDDVISIKKFAGLNQSNDGHNVDLAYATGGYNFDTSYGGLKSYRQAVPLPQVADTVDQTIPYTAGTKFTLAFLVKRWQYNNGVIGKSDSYTNAFAIAFANGTAYYRKKVNNTFAGVAWTKIKDASGNNASFTDCRFDTVTYELNYLPPVTITDTIAADIKNNGTKYVVFDNENGFDYYLVKSSDGLAANAYYTDNQGSNHNISSLPEAYRGIRLSLEDAPADCLLITNKTDGLFCIYVTAASNVPVIAPIHVGPLSEQTSIKGDAICRHNDRVWIGAMLTDPDKLIYSAPFDPFNWEQDNEDIANGAGDVQQPTWDGDEIIAIKEFGPHMVIAKKHSIWRITGSGPDEYTYHKQYGEGTIFEDSFAVNGMSAFMLTDDDVKVYDGNSTQHLRYGYAKDILAKMVSNPSIPNTGRMVQDKYILNLMTNEWGGIFLIYDTVEGTVNLAQNMIRGNVALETYDDELYGLYIYGISPFLTIQFGKFLTDDGRDKPMIWKSSWIDLNAKNVVKSGFIVYLRFESEDAPSTASVDVRLSIITDKKEKYKDVTIPINKTKRIRLCNSGRQFMIELMVQWHEYEEQEYHWKLASGIQIYLEYDQD